MTNNVQDSVNNECIYHLQQGFRFFSEQVGHSDIIVKLVDCICHYSPSLELNPEENIDAKFCSILTHLFWLDFPDLWWVGSIYGEQVNGVVKKLCVRYKYEKEVVKQYLKLVDNEVKRILSSKDLSKMSCVQKMHYFQSYLDKCTTYNTEWLEKVMIGHQANSICQNKQAAEFPQNIVGGFVFHLHVCAGYAACFKYLCDSQGINSIIILGTLNTPQYPGVSHTWNMTFIGGKWYHFDANINKLPTPMYFNVPYEYIKRDHTTEGGVGTDQFFLKYPDATSWDANFYQVQGKRIENFDRVKQLFQVQGEKLKKQSEIVVTAMYDSSLTASIHDLFHKALQSMQSSHIMIKKFYQFGRNVLFFEDKIRFTLVKGAAQIVMCHGLGIDNHAQKLADFLRSCKQNPPFTIQIWCPDSANDAVENQIVWQCIQKSMKILGRNFVSVEDFWGDNFYQFTLKQYM